MSAPLTIGLDVGGTKVLGGIVDAQGTVLATVRKPSPVADAQATIAVMAQVVDELRAGTQDAIGGIGVGVAGHVDRSARHVLWAPNLRWRDVALADDLERLTSLPVIADNDGNVAAWGEFVHGSGAGMSDVTAVTVGTGIGGGIISDGRLLRGGHGGAAEIGHITFVPEGLLCGCGRYGCWEQYGSGTALVRYAREQASADSAAAAQVLALGNGTVEGLEGVHVTQAALAGDDFARAVLAHQGRILGMGMADLASVLDPQAFIVSGGVSTAGDLLLDSAREALAAHITGGADRPLPQIRVASLGVDAGLIGAAALARR